mgnify:CR=1 FL=1
MELNAISKNLDNLPGTDWIVEWTGGGLTCWQMDGISCRVVITSDCQHWYNSDCGWDIGLYSVVDEHDEGIWYSQGHKCDLSDILIIAEMLADGTTHPDDETDGDWLS